MIGLELDNVSAEASGRTLLEGVSLTLSAGSFLAIAGPNGSGKSTLLRLASGLWRPARGAVRLDGADLRRIPRREIARRMAFLPQNTHLEFDFTVREIVAMGRYAHRGRFAAETPEDLRVIEGALRAADVSHLRSRLATEISGGERQRVLIARCLAARPGIILLDEPTASLDPDHTLEVLDLCRRLAAQGTAVAIATHDLNAASRFAAEIALLCAGRLRALGPPARVLTPAALREVFGVEAEPLPVAAGGTVFVFHHIPKGVSC